LINLDNLKALSKDNSSFIKEILQVYLENAPQDFDKLKLHALKKEWPHVRYYAHKLKSSSFTIGFDEGFALFQTMERTIKNREDTDSIAHLIDKAEECCKRSFIEVKNELQSFE
jgi:HPt (histidine-containing phosphotransfer) domain-containing protein